MPNSSLALTTLALGISLANFVARIALANHINPATSTNDLAIGMAKLESTDRRNNLHFIPRSLWGCVLCCRILQVIAESPTTLSELRYIEHSSARRTSSANRVLYPHSPRSQRQFSHENSLPGLPRRNRWRHDPFRPPRCRCRPGIRARRPPFHGPWVHSNSNANRGEKWISSPIPHHISPPESECRYFRDIQQLIDQSDILPAAKKLAISIFARIAEAEARVHGVGMEEIHFHEVGAIDSICDIVGTAIAWTQLGIEKAVASPVPTGFGTIQIAHGTVSLPAPATAELLRGIPVAPCTIPVELTTPTGAAILAELVSQFGPVPAMAIEKLDMELAPKIFSIAPMSSVFSLVKPYMRIPRHPMK